MPASITISPLSLPASALLPLATVARVEGHAFIDRLLAEWDSFANRFDRPGERLLAAWQDNAVVAVGGLNRDPYVNDDRIGRLRHVYVRPPWRQIGIGRRLVEALIAGPHPFEIIRLRTTNPRAARMYEHLGFAAIVDVGATHVITGCRRT